MLGHEDIKRAIEKGEKEIRMCEEGSLYSVSKIRRILIYLAGPIANIILAIVFFTLYLCLPNVISDSKARIVLSSDYPALYSNDCPASEAGLITGDFIYSVNDIEVSSYSELSAALSQFKDSKNVRIKTDRATYTVTPQNNVFGILPYKDAIVGSVQLDSNEHKSGLKSGDLILSANGQTVSNMFDILNEAETSPAMELLILRSGTIKLISFEVTDKTLNFTLKGESIEKPGEKFSHALKKAADECIFEASQFYGSLISLIKGKIKLSQTISGTISTSESIGMMTTKAFSASLNTGIKVTLYLLASVSISLAIANFLPITALDGGLILISFIELVFRRSLNPKTYVVLQILGLLTLFVVIPVAKLLF